jgi:NAD(P)-dependent dehydrogenase (short-subunit alcohol dehydrogenase family)
MGNCAGKVVLITGAGKGTGRGVAEAFAAQGASVAVNDISPVNLDETLAHIAAAGGQVKAYVSDQSDGPERRAAYFASKAGLAALSALAAYELSEYNIRVYHVQPEEMGDVVKHILELCG